MTTRNTLPPAKIGLAGPLVLLLLMVALVWAAGDRMLRLEFALYDFFQQQSSAVPSDRILIVDTGPGQDTLWNDARLPAVIKSLEAAGAQVIVPSQAPPANAALPNMQQLTALLQLEQQAREGGSNVDALSSQLDGFKAQYAVRSAIQAALAASGRAVVPMTPANPREPAGLDPCPRLAATLADDNSLTGILPARELVALPPVICEQAAGAGYAGFRPDPDGTVRETTLVVHSAKRVTPTLALASLATAQGDSPPLVGPDGQLHVNERPVKTGPAYSILLRYYEQQAQGTNFAQVSVEQILAKNFDPALARGRIALLGPLDTDAAYPTPLEPALPGILLTATSLSNLLQNDYLLRPDWLAWSELLLLVGLAALFAVLAPGMSLNAAALAAVFIGAILLTTEAYLLLAHGVWARLGLATVFSALGIMTIVGLRHLRQAQPLPTATPQPAGAGIGMGDELDLAFSVLRQQPPNDDTKEKLYKIAVKHGRRREYAKAERVLRYLASVDPSYRGVTDKLKKLSGAARREREAEESKGKPVAAPRIKRVAREASEDGIQRLGRYEVDKVLGRGAMATVYLGRDPKINRKVAIKTIALAEEFSDEDLNNAKAQFMREAESAGRLNHPNIISIYDVDEDGDVAYLAMEYFEGQSLAAYATQGNLLPPEWVLELGARAAEALHYAHSQNVVHRDIKPANIMYSANSDDLKLTDFGIARLTDTSRTKTGIILGTPSYMPPEQLAGSPVSGQSDLYSLGITLYHLLTGGPPFRADSIPKLMDKIVNDRHPTLSTIRDDIPPGLDEVFDRALAKDPADRFPNGRAMALALRDCCSNFSK
ncbi:MAG: protein kinase domain-containing protein [Gammaproteobacteria bacterium]